MCSLQILTITNNFAEDMGYIEFDGLSYFQSESLPSLSDQDPNEIQEVFEDPFPPAIFEENEDDNYEIEEVFEDEFPPGILEENEEWQEEFNDEGDLIAPAG